MGTDTTYARPTARPAPNGERGGLLAPAADQTHTPYLTALLGHVASGPLRLTVPGHKGGASAPDALRAALGADALALDVPAITEGIDVGEAPTALERARELAAQAVGAQRTWFCLNGASQGNHAVCLALALAGHRDVVVQRSAHGSTIDGLVLSGLRPSWVLPEIDPELGVPHTVTPAALAAALRAAPQARAALVLSPSYHGAVADVRGLAAVAHAHGAELIVDEAWGAHLAFATVFPAHALACGADVVISSTHKHLGSLTGTAMLHLGPRASLPAADVERAFALVGTTSPNALALASLDATRQRAACDGEQLATRTLHGIAALCERLRSLPGVEIGGDRFRGREGVHALDPLRVVIDVRATGLDGRMIARALREQHDIHVELSDRTLVLVLIGLGEEVEPLAERLVAGLAEILATATITSVPTARVAPAPSLAAPRLTPREAALAPAVTVPLDAAVGRVAAQSLSIYPPGIPQVLPGEPVTAALVAQLRAAARLGCTIRGLDDDRVRVLATGPGGCA